MTAEERRLTADRDRQAYWRRWGPYLSERQWIVGSFASGLLRLSWSPVLFFPPPR